ncbi:MAG: RNA polymerase sigma factor RpoD/SigA [Methylococcaceae bacterium]|nr:RNA polymerase sigma factor RpoD/SigA [Methylococcaceae bacterium]
MALRDFYPLSETTICPATNPLATVCDLPKTFQATIDEPLPCIGETLVEPDLEPVSSSTRSLALRMEQARQQLLELLLLNPYALELLSAQLSSTSGEGVDYMIGKQDKIDTDIVQDHCFVQPANTSIDNPPHQREPSSIHFFPALLIRVAEQIQTMPCDELGYKTKLVACRRNLQTIRQQMISSNTGLVAFVAYKHKTTTLSFDDLMQEGIVGLIRAVDRFDPSRGIRFSTYAIFWIKQAISRLIVKQEKVVRLPVALAEKASIVFEAMRSCYLEHNRWPSLPELQGRCDLSLEEIKSISGYYQATHSLDASLTDENDDQTLMASLKQHQFALPLNELIANNLSLYLSKVVASLPEKEATILNMRFGLKNHTEMTLQAVADQLHVTRERVRQIQNKALKTIKQQFGYDLMPFLEPNDN